MPNDFLINSIIGIQYQLRALDCSLEVLARQMQPKLNSSTGTDPRNPVCPNCGGAIIDVSLVGQTPKEFQCAACDFRGPLE